MAKVHDSFDMCKLYSNNINNNLYIIINQTNKFILKRYTGGKQQVIFHAKVLHVFGFIICTF